MPQPNRGNHPVRTRFDQGGLSQAATQEALSRIKRYFTACVCGLHMVGPVDHKTCPECQAPCWSWRCGQKTPEGAKQDMRKRRPR